MLINQQVKNLLGETDEVKKVYEKSKMSSLSVKVRIVNRECLSPGYRLGGEV